MNRLDIAGSVCTMNFYRSFQSKILKEIYR
jgi:hypothetical protein